MKSLPQDIEVFITNKIELTNYCLPHFYPEPNLEALLAFQSGYKFDQNHTDLTGTKKGDFLPSWYVICSAYAGQPFFIDVNESDKNFPVYFAWTGAGEWLPLEVGFGILEFLDVLKKIAQLEHEKDAILDENELVNEQLNKQFKDKLKHYIGLSNSFWLEVLNEYG